MKSDATISAAGVSQALPAGTRPDAPFCASLRRYSGRNLFPNGQPAGHAVSGPYENAKKIGAAKMQRSYG